MAIIIRPEVNSKSPAIISFDSKGIGKETCILEIKLDIVPGRSVDVAAALQIINLGIYHFSDGEFVKGQTFNSCTNADVITMNFKLKRIVSVPPGGLPGCSIRIITWDKTSNSQQDKRVKSVTFNV